MKVVDSFFVLLGTIIVFVWHSTTVVAGATVPLQQVQDSNVEFLEINKKKKDVITLPSGLQYKILSSGPSDGKHPDINDACTCHYDGSLATSYPDGSFFDSSRSRGRGPATFAPSGVIAGWTEALQLMKPGDRWILYIPASLGYGSRGSGKKIPSGSALVFDLELISVSEGGGNMFSSLFVGTSLNNSVIGPLKLWHVLLVLILFQLSGYFFKSRGDGAKVTASHILVADRNLALLEELKATLIIKQESSCSSSSSNNASSSSSPTIIIEAEFAKLAKQHSTCPSGKRSGGSLGTFGKAQMVPAFDKICWEAPVGVVQGPVRTQFGYHLILVTDRNDDDDDDDGADKKLLPGDNDNNNNDDNDNDNDDSKKKN